MEKDQLLNELKNNIEEYNALEEKTARIMYAVYDKTVNEIKNNKIKEIQEYFSNQANYYEQNTEDYRNEIDLIIKEYKNQIDSLKEAYDYLYINIYKKMQAASSNQLIAVGNIVTLTEKKEKSNNSQRINKQIMAVLQKKVNYSVIIEECKARLNWCTENIQKDIDEIFENKFYQLVEYKNGFFDRLKRKISNMINGKKKFSDVIAKYERENLKKIADNNNEKMVNIIAITKGILDQIKNVDEQINSQYENAMQNI